ncbi:hypothetical protein KIPB_007938 [Kipferlia bialata]|uniref:Uncharacterized protein n=1 Tax=Kipferlia bialata TaxID=797122 RepID=A0A9K3GKG3_9EUKA|nr:hypothetical protein KIPB_007938 [Kipferlia bialata]|eukprot:g7938.t1
MDDTLEQVRTLVAKGQREDGRDLTEFPELGLKFPRGTAPVALCTIGDSAVSASASVTLAYPQASMPNRGIFTVLPLDSNPALPPSLQSALSLVLHSAFKNIVDTDTLCVEAGSRVWKVAVTVQILTAGGNVVDCCVGAVSALLLLVRVPVCELSTSTGEVVVYTATERPPMPLRLKALPLCSTFSLVPPYRGLDKEMEEEEPVAVAGPGLEEARAGEGIVCVVVTKGGEIHGVHKTGPVGISVEAMVPRFAEAAARCDTLTEQIEASVRTEQAGRELDTVATLKRGGWI